MRGVLCAVEDRQVKVVRSRVGRESRVWEDRLGNDGR